MYYPEFFEGVQATASTSSSSNVVPPPPPPPPLSEMTRLRSQETVATIGSMAGEFCELMKSGSSFHVDALELVASTSKSGDSITNLLFSQEGDNANFRFPSLQKMDLDWLLANENDDDDDDDDDDVLELDYDENTASLPPPPPPPPLGMMTRRTSSRLQAKSTTVHKARRSSVEKPKQQQPQQRRQRKVYEIATHQRNYVQYTDADVLCQRGGLGNQHAGNKRYLAAKDAMQALYQATPKAGRTAVAQQLVDQVRAWGGRFLAKDAQGWYEIHNHKARTKASQALREDYTKEELRAKRNKYKANQQQHRDN